MSRFALTAELVFDGKGYCRDVAVVIEEARIVEVVPRSTLESALKLNDLGAGTLAAGFIDLQVNGGAGVLLNETPTLEGVRRIAEAHRRYGTTGLLPTVITDAPEVMHRAAAAVREAIRKGVPGVLGIHIEGPFIDPARKGAHDPRFIRKPTEADIEWLIGLDCGRVMVTLAPNIVPPETVYRLARAGITVSLGHSNASAEQAISAIDAGARCFTHLFNAMSQMTARAPGMVGAAFAYSAYCGIIADGHHVDPRVLEVARAAKGDELFLVSDAMPCAAGGPEQFLLQGRQVQVVDGRLQLADGTLAGANITMREAVRYCKDVLHLQGHEYFRMASLNPATALRLETELGLLAPNYRANLVHLSDNFDVLETWIDGVSSK